MIGLTTILSAKQRPREPFRMYKHMGRLFKCVTGPRQATLQATIYFIHGRRGTCPP